ncbi:MAG: PQQ-dependent sugar dehydrogenase [Capsulimonadales bacterium]|nr:PQQ-dependent sugar dehydrogenase [Capsulimonadales bacterium]
MIRRLLLWPWFALGLFGAMPAAAQPGTPVLTGTNALGDYTRDRPGLRRRFAPSALPAPYASALAWAPSETVARPANVLPRTMPGFSIRVFADNIDGPRKIAVAPNGDIFVVRSYSNAITVFRGIGSDGRPLLTRTFLAGGLNQPFGLRFYPAGSAHPTHLYIANTDSVVRIPYRNGDTEARRAPEVVVDNTKIPGGAGQLGGGGHWTRDLIFSPDNRKLFVSVGSFSDHGENGIDETNRACILEFAVDRAGLVPERGRVFASGIRNPVGLAIHPRTGQLWTTCNERDNLGNDLVPDYVTQVREQGFYGWPYFYMGTDGGRQDPRWGTLPTGIEEKREQVLTPDVPIQAHSAVLGLTPYTGRMFPGYYRYGFFAAAHGSWNRNLRTGYKILFIPTHSKTGQALGEYMDFVTGFVLNDRQVFGRPVDVAVARDGSLLITDDAGGVIWRVTYGPYAR